MGVEGKEEGPKAGARDSDDADLKALLLRIVNAIVRYMQRHPEKTADEAAKAVLHPADYRVYGTTFRDAAVRRLQEQLAEAEKKALQHQREEEIAESASGAMATPGD
jgi:hypothetical protein